MKKMLKNRLCLILLILFTSVASANFEVDDTTLVTNLTFTPHSKMYFEAKNLIVINTFSENGVNTDVEELSINSSRLSKLNYKIAETERIDIGLYHMDIIFEDMTGAIERDIDLEILAFKGGNVASQLELVNIQKPHFFKQLSIRTNAKIGDFKTKLETDTVGTAVDFIIVFMGIIFLLTVVIIIVLRLANK